MTILKAVESGLAVATFDKTGRAMTANPGYLEFCGGSLAKLKDLDRPAAWRSGALTGDALWSKLEEGETLTAEYEAARGGGQTASIVATLVPSFGMFGKFSGVVEFAADTADGAVAELAGKVNAIDRSQAVIEFELDGTIIKANDNFLGAMGYTLEEIVGKHHRIFVDPKESAQAEYKEFWATLKRGEFQSAEYRRVNNKGEDFWIQATYNPIFGPTGEPVKVVK
ncbi:MAG: PAS domain-containing protein, partial [Pseudomonadota bacterium]